MTGLRTHRYLRLALVGVVLALAVSILTEVIRSGGVVLPSLSDYYYTPARGVFVGSLTAAGVALLALSGRDAESVFLDVAAVFAPLVAIVPTGFSGAERIPVDDLAGVRNGVSVYTAVVAALVVLGIVLAAFGQLPWRRLAVVGGIASVTATTLAALAFSPGSAGDFPFVGGWDLHFVVTVAFFAAFAAVPAVTALRREGDDSGSRMMRTAQRVVPVVIALALAVTVVGALAARESTVVLIGESVALAAFAAYWLAQTIERWDDVNPPSIIAR